MVLPQPGGIGPGPAPSPAPSAQARATTILQSLQGFHGLLFDQHVYMFWATEIAAGRWESFTEPPPGPGPLKRGGSGRARGGAPGAERGAVSGAASGSLGIAPPRLPPAPKASSGSRLPPLPPSADYGALSHQLEFFKTQLEDEQLARQELEQRLAATEGWIRVLVKERALPGPEDFGHEPPDESGVGRHGRCGSPEAAAGDEGDEEDDGGG